MSNPFQIDADMMGDAFNGTLRDLREFLPILAEQTGLPEESFALRQHVAQQPDAVEVSDWDWDQAVQAFQDQRPDLWR